MKIKSSYKAILVNPEIFVFGATMLRLQNFAAIIFEYILNAFSSYMFDFFGHATSTAPLILLSGQFVELKQLRFVAADKEF